MTAARQRQIESDPFPLSQSDRDVIVRMARELTGTNIDGDRHSVIFLNIQIRMDVVGARTLSGYLAYVDRHESETAHLLSALTIHTTGWFRESGTFDLFHKKITEQVRNNQLTSLNLLSIGCSTGEEVFSYAFVLEEISRIYHGFQYSLKGLDIDPISLKRAREGRYERVKMDGAATEWMPLLARRIDGRGTLVVEPRIMDLVHFQSSNILTVPASPVLYDAISVRNILIYFDGPQLAKIMNIICRSLKPGGLLFTGVSETNLVDRDRFATLNGAMFQMRPKMQHTLLPHGAIDAGSGKASAKHLIIIEDERELAALYESTLSDSYSSISVATTYEDGLASVLKFGSDGFVITDYILACGRNGLDLMEEARRLGFKGDFVLISGFADQGIAGRAHALGCKDVITKPCIGAELLRTVQRYAAVTKNQVKEKFSSVEVLAFGSSTGGTEVLVKILEGVPQPCPPVVVVQHIVTEFAEDYAKRLADRSGLILGKMVEGEVLKPGHLYMALGDYHIAIRKLGGCLSLAVNKSPQISGHRPSVDFLFDSIATARVRAMAVVLTGMGRDGAQGLQKLRKQGCFTMVQDEASSIVFGMPGEAIKLGAAEFVGNPRQIQSKIHEMILTVKL